MAELEFILEAPEDGRVVAFPSRSFVIGSGDDCQVCFKSGSVSARHAEIVKDERGAWWIRDLLGNGTVIVNNQPVLDERLNAGDRLRIGDVILTVRNSGVSAHARTRSGESPMAAVAGVNGPSSSPAGELQPETVIDSRYKVLKRIAAGGMGEVYRAVHVELGKPLALKVMLPELSGDPDFVGRFKREAVASSRIGQQNIIDISDFGRTADGRFYFVMEYVDGKTLVKHRKEGPFDFQRVVHVGLQIARALAAAHAAGIVHRDLKPDNIMLVQRTGQPDFVKVLDFGIAKVQSPNGTGAAFTAIGSVVGTPQYMAPEQASGLPVDQRSDIYSMGLILHELVRGKPTFNADSAVELMGMQVHSPPPPLTSPYGQVPRALERIIQQMVEKNPGQRPASMEAVVAALEAIASFPTPTARTEPITAPASTRGPGMNTQVEVGAHLGTGAVPVTRVLTPSDPRAVITAAADPRTVQMEPVASTTLNQRPVDAGPDTTSEGELEALRPSRTPWLVGGLAVLAIIGALAGLALVGPEEAATLPKAEVPVVAPTPAATPELKPAPPPPPAQAVKLALEAIPEHVEVFEDDILLGSTPLTLTRPAGTLTALRFEAKGFLPLNRKVRFESDTALRLELEKAGGKRPATTPRGPRAPADDLMDLPD